MVNRNYVLDRLKSRTMKIDEFNFDKLWAPPIAAMFAPQDIMQLDYIATSLKYSAKPRAKYQEIDNIMRRRGFEKFIAGTNRVAYRCLENDSIIAKVAYDDVGRSDSIREFHNQMIFKPFVTKIFEYTPSGTLAIVERTIPITSREEFRSVAADIYEVINNWFVGEYVLEDIGTNFFQNWSIRKGFGPVLHDFPYAYKLDGNKLFCNSPNPLSPTGKCEGVIDYDAGFNFLFCTKCGAMYRGKELEVAIKENNVIVKSEGEIKMKIRISGGTHNVNKEVVTGEYADLAKKTPTANISKYPAPVRYVDTKKNEVANEKKENKITHSKSPVNTTNVKVSEVVVDKDDSSIYPTNMKTFEYPPVEKFITDVTQRAIIEENEEVKLPKGNQLPTPTVEKKDPIVQIDTNSAYNMSNASTLSFVRKNDSKSGVVATEKKVTSAVSFNGGGTEPEKSNIDNFNYCLKRALEIFEKSSEDEQKEMSEMIKEGFKDSITEAVTEVKEVKEEVINAAIQDYITDNLEDVAINCLERISEAYDGEDFVDLMESILDNKNLERFVKEIVGTAFETRFGILTFHKQYYYDDSSNGIVNMLNPYIVENPNDHVNESEDTINQIAVYGSIEMKNPICVLQADEHIKNAGFIKESEITESDDDSDEEVVCLIQSRSYIGFHFCAAQIINAKDIFQDIDPCKIIVLLNEDGSYLNIGGDIIAIDSLNNKSVDSLAIVSSNWLNGVQYRLGKYENGESDEDDIPESTVEEVNDDSDEGRLVYRDTSDDSPMQTVIPTGVLAPGISEPETPPVGVNGVV